MFHVVVIGAGLGGLALAQGLRQAGVDVTVYERDASLTARRQGYRLHLDAEARDCLVELLPPHLVHRFLAIAGVPDPRFTQLDHQLNHLFTQESDQAADFSVDRLMLRRFLLSGLEDRVVFGKRFHHYRHDDRITASFTDGSEVTCDVLVAADGVSSAVRHQYLPHARIVDTGVRQLYGRIPLTGDTRALFDDRMFGIFTAITGPDRTFLGVAPVEFPGYMTCSFGARREWFGDTEPHLRTLSGAELHAIVTRAVRTWHPRVRDIVAHCEPATLFALPLRTSVPIAGWRTTPVTLLGDAIHAMSPAAGAGACTALRDAARLTTALTASELIPALRDYEKDMTEHGFAMVRAAASNGERFLGQDPLPVGVTGTRTTP